MVPRLWRVFLGRSGGYKWMPIAGSVLVAIALVLVSTLNAESPLWEICAYLAVMGLGLGLSMQMLVLIVQNSFPLREVGTAQGVLQLLPPDRGHPRRHANAFGLTSTGGPGPW
jgi:hypothetical protein